MAVAGRTQLQDGTAAEQMQKVLFLCLQVVKRVDSRQAEEQAGSDAVTSVFVEKGKDVRLDVMKADVLEGLHMVSWSFNNTFVLVRFLPGRRKTEESAKVRLEFIWHPVSPVQLTVDSSSSDSCNLDVTCNTTDSHISGSFRCDTQTCSQEGGERSHFITSGTSLHIYLVNESIVCNYSNKVSWTMDIIMIGLFYPQSDGSDAVTHVFVQKGKDVRLDVMKADVLEGLHMVSWSFNKYICFDPVSPVQLTVDSVSSSSDSCNLDVTCNTTDSHISGSFRCDTQTCSQEGGERSHFITSGTSLHIYLVNESIVCNYSNKVSWTTDIIMIGLFCPQSDGKGIFYELLPASTDIDSSILLGQYQAGSLALTSTHPILSSVVGESVRLV
ncbi:hypothetical protein L3Q82_021239 [Scortum barcoo]|uniref:Uncharacterized protein n=1 Tax=Scortum barcoo TaxID=214431 RepID=A0ACB8X2X6_9TELE|nr:hypothetical protein L3Q82_021239 [Scortum barcoo]